MANDSNPPQVSIVIVSWNVSALLRLCLRSIERVAPELSREVVVVDNASADDSVAMVRAEFPSVKLISSRENLGFARGNNLALDHVRGRFVFFLNPDTELWPGCLEKLTRFLDTHPQAGVVGPRLLSPDGSVQDTCARHLPSLRDVIGIDVLGLHRLRPFRAGRFALKRLAYDLEQTQPVEGISGSAMLMRREILDELGGFGTGFHHCGEDLELCARVRAAGWQIWYDRAATLTHVGGASSRREPLHTYVKALLSYDEYFRRCHGAKHAFAYRQIARYVGVPAFLAKGVLRLTTSLPPGPPLSEQLRAARAIWHWRPM
jgi:GT2 family glycosyltransferase